MAGEPGRPDEAEEQDDDADRHRDAREPAGAGRRTGRARPRPGRPPRTPGSRCTRPTGSLSSWSTGSSDGHAFAHFAQSMQASGSRRMRIGLSERDQAEQRAVGAQVAAPEVLHEHRQHHQHGDARPRRSGPRWRKKFSIFTSAMTPYGLSRKAAMAAADMRATAQRNNPSSTYFRPRSGMSSQRGSAEVAAEESRGRPATATPRSCPPGRASCRRPCGRRRRCRGTR